MPTRRSEEHTSELQSRNDISYAVFCLKKKKPSNLEPGPRQPRGKQVITKALQDILLVDVCPHAVCRYAYPLGFFFFFNDTATTEIYTSLHTLSLHDALLISRGATLSQRVGERPRPIPGSVGASRDRKSTRLNSSHVTTSRMPSSA